jgi:hypothetical protein
MYFLYLSILRAATFHYFFLCKRVETDTQKVGFGSGLADNRIDDFPRCYALPDIATPP